MARGASHGMSLESHALWPTLAWAVRAGGGQPLVQGGLGRGHQHSPKSLEHICSIMPSALCSISHWVQILDTVVRDQPLSQLADACHLGQLCGDMLGEPWQPPCSLGSCAGVMLGAQSPSLADVPATPAPPRRDGIWGHPLSSCQCFGAQQQAAVRVAPA